MSDVVKPAPSPLTPPRLATMTRTNRLHPECDVISKQPGVINAGPYLMMTHWFSRSIIMFLYMLSARA